MSTKGSELVKRPNVIWIFGDQHPAHMLGCNGDPNIHTPNIDSLAHNGVNFYRAVAGFPLCCPFRGSLLTSRYPHDCVPGHEFQMDPTLPTIADVFNANGYHTAYFGKWHVDGFHESEGRAAFHIVPPNRRGRFQTWVGYENNNVQYDSWVHGGEGDTAFHYQLPGYETDELTSLVIKHLEEQHRTNPNQPFFTILSVQPPHNPYYAPEEFMLHFHNDEDFSPKALKLRPNVPNYPKIKDQACRELAGAYAMVENLDWNIGRILEKLREMKIDENTLIIFFSDHGDMHGSHGLWRKTNPFEESLRIPFIIGTASQKKSDSFVQKRLEIPINHVDIAPTTLGLCGLEPPQWMKGRNFSRIIRPDGVNNNELKMDTTPLSAYIQSVIPTGHQDSTDKPWRGVVTQDGWKYVCFEGMEWLLFNLNDDPYELVNLANESRFVAKKEVLNALLGDWIKQTEDDFPIPNLKSSRKI